MTRHIPFEEAELLQHVRLARFLCQQMGDPVPSQQVDLTQVHTALDVARGVGAWALDLTQAFPHIQVTGIDGSMDCIASARRQR